MANVRDSDTSLWLHNKLGTSNDSWTSGSICSQLNKEVLRNIRDCFSDMQTQVKLKLLLSFFHIPRRLVEEWKSELDDIIEVAAADSELWVSMIAETIKTYPATGSLNTEISEFEETRPIFTDMGNDLKKLVNKHSDLGMLPLECLYLNKTTLTSIVGQQNTSVKHFTLKRKPKSATLRTELLQKSVDAQSLSLKKGSAPVIPLRSRGMPRKMTDTTPLKGIPSRMPTTGFKSPTSSSSQNVTSQNARPNISRPGRKDGGIKLLDITEQPLGYAQAKKRKKQQENEEQQKKLLLEIQTAEKEKKELSDANNCHTPDVKPTAAILTESNECVALASTPTSTPDYAAGLNASSVIYTQPATPLSIKTEFQSLASSTATTTQATSTVADNKKIIIEKQQTVLKVERIVKDETEEPKIIVSKITRRVADTVPTPVVSKVSISENCIVSSSPATISTIPNLIPTQQQPQKTTIIYSKNSQLLQQQHSASASSLIAKISQQQQLSQPSGVTYVTTTTDTAAILSSLPKSVANTLKQSPVKITQTTIMQAPGPAQQNHNKPQTLTIQGSAQLIQSIQQQQQQNKIQRFQIQTSNGNLQNIPALTSISSSGTNSTISLINNSQLNSINTGNVTINHNNFGTAPPPLQMQTNQGTKIVQIKTTPTNQINKQITNLQNLPPLIPTQSAALKMQQAHQQTQKILVTTTQPSMITSLPGQTTITQHQQPQQQKFTQVMMQIPTSNAGTSSSMKTGKTYILTAPNMLTQKAVLVSSVDADGNRVYQQIPISNLQDSSGGSVMPGLIKSNQQQTVSIVSGNQMHNVAPQQMPALVPTGQQQQLVIQQQPQQAGQTIIRPLLLSNSNQMQLPQGLTLIQRPGQQPQLVQTISQPQQQQQHQQIGQTQFQRVQLPSQIGQVQIRQQPTLIQIQQPQQQTQMPQQHTVQIQQIQQPQQQKVQMQQRPQQQIILTKTVAAPQHQQQQQQQQPQQQQKTVQQRQNVTIVQHTNAQRGQPARKLLSLSSEHVSKANEIFRKANKVTRPDKALILGFMGGCRENPRPTPENILVIKLSEREEEVKQKDNSYLHMMVESLIKLDYNTGEWSTFQNARRIEKKSIVTQPTAKDQKKEAKVA